MFGTQQEANTTGRQAPIWAVTLHYQWTVTITLPSDDRGFLCVSRSSFFWPSWVRADTL